MTTTTDAITQVLRSSTIPLTPYEIAQDLAHNMNQNQIWNGIDMMAESGLIEWQEGETADQSGWVLVNP